MTRRKREQASKIMEAYFQGRVNKEEFEAMIETIKQRKEVAIYCRVVSRENSRDILDEERAQLEQYARANGYTITAYFEDAGYPGYDLDRPGLQGLLEAYAAGEFEAVLVLYHSRLYRGHERPRWDFEVLVPHE